MAHLSLKPFGPFLKPYRVYCILGPAAKLAEAVLELYLPLLMAKVIDDGIAKGDTGYILKMGGVMLGIVTVGLLCALVCQYVASVTSQGFGTGLRHAVFRRISIPVPRGAGRLRHPVPHQPGDQRRQSAPVRGGHADPAGDPRAVFVRGWDRHGHDHRSAAVTGDYRGYPAVRADYHPGDA